jgi:trehalose-6-phosphate synthase
MQFLEFVSIKKLQKKFEKSSCIVSEFAGAANSLIGAIISNPYDIENISSCIELAINLSPMQRL